MRVAYGVSLPMSGAAKKLWAKIIEKIPGDTKDKIAADILFLMITSIIADDMINFAVENSSGGSRDDMVKLFNGLLHMHHNLLERVDGLAN